MNKDMDNKKAYIISFLDENVNMPTNKIISNVLAIFRTGVSKRHVQRVRREYKATLKNVGKEKKMENGLSSEQIEIINTANEGGWTIQDLAERHQLDPEKIKEILNKYNYMVTGEVLDSENEEVYFTSEEEDGTDEENDVVVLEDGTDEEIIDLLDAIPDSIPDAPLSASQLNTEENFWEVEIDVITACSKCSKSVDVFVNHTARTKAMMYMKWAGPREWLAYLIGEFKEGAYYITDLYLPDQRTSSVLVDDINADGYNNNTVIGVIHSHHEMGAGDEDNPSFSSHDNNFINGNHNLSLLAGRDSKSGGFKVVGIARIETPCGGLMRVKANIKSSTEMTDDQERNLKKDFLKKTQTKVPERVVGNNPYLGNHHQCSNISHVTKHGNKKTYHFTPGGYPGNQQTFRGHKKCHSKG
jgi:ribosomal silencing factor RsfS